jgi:hypothetical protein
MFGVFFLNICAGAVSITKTNLDHNHPVTAPTAAPEVVSIDMVDDSMKHAIIGWASLGMSNQAIMKAVRLELGMKATSVDASKKVFARLVC